jgi:hypothetical protein
MSKVTNFNTTNAWGFGGSIGTSTILDCGIVIVKGKAFYRHAPPSYYKKIYFSPTSDDSSFKIYTTSGKLVDNEKDVNGKHLYRCDIRDSHYSEVYFISDTNDLKPEGLNLKKVFPYSTEEAHEGVNLEYVKQIHI